VEGFPITKLNKIVGIKTTIYTRELRGGETILSLKFKETLAKVKVEPESQLKSGDTVSTKIKRALNHIDGTQSCLKKAHFFKNKQKEIFLR